MSVSVNDAERLKLDVGGGEIPREGYTNLDPAHGAGQWKREAQDTPWPTADDSVEAIYASHVMEHIPSGQPRIAVMNEAHRVMVPEGLFTIRVPKFPTWQAIADPTHVSYWVAQSFGYFCQKSQDANYGIRYWRKVSLEDKGWEIVAVLAKPLL